MIAINGNASSSKRHDGLRRCVLCDSRSLWPLGKVCGDVGMNGVLGESRFMSLSSVSLLTLLLESERGGSIRKSCGLDCAIASGFSLYTERGREQRKGFSIQFCTTNFEDNACQGRAGKMEEQD